MIKLIFCDMDGTLLDEAGELPPDFRETADELIRRGVIFAPASGRQYSALLRQMGGYIDDFIFVAENGTFVARHDEELFSSEMEKDLVLRVIEAGSKIPASYPVLCGKRVAYIGNEWRPHLREMEKYFTKNEVVDDMLLAAREEEIIKVAFCDAERGDAGRNIYDRLRIIDGPVRVVLSSSYWVDVMNPDVNKGTAVRRLQKLLGVAPDECAAFGDYLNDIEMLESVKYSFAMENAHPDVKAAAAFSAPPNTERGVTRAIKRLIADGLI